MMQIIESKVSMSRLVALDVLKALSIVAVISFHAISVPETSYVDSDYIVEVMFAPLRFCVPVFLTISFLLLQRSCDSPIRSSTARLLLKRMTRIAIPTCFWFSIAGILIFARGIINSDSIQQTFSLIMSVALKGTIFPGAYYLLILLQLLPIFIYFNQFHWFASIKPLAIAVSLQIFVFIGIHFLLRDGSNPGIIETIKQAGRVPFLYWFVYGALGSYFYYNWSKLKQLSLSVATRFKILFLGLTALLMILEYSWLYADSGHQVRPFEYATVSGILSAFVLFFCVLSIEEKNLPTLVLKGVKLLSTYSLGIFCINGFLSNALHGISSVIFRTVTSFTLLEILTIKLVGWAVLIGLSLVISIGLDKVGLRACVR
jgi:Acyltransferase family